MAISVSSNRGASALLSAVLIFIAHNGANTLLLTPLNPLRCLYWYEKSCCLQPCYSVVDTARSSLMRCRTLSCFAYHRSRDQCTRDEKWILNWLAYSHFHVTILLLSMVATSVGQIDQEASLAHLTSSLMVAYLIEGIFSLDLIHPSMAALQCGVYVLLLIAILYLSVDMDSSTIMDRRKVPPHRDNLASSPPFDDYNKRPNQSIVIPTLTVGLISALSMFRVIEMTFGSVRMGYLGDTSR